MHRLQPPAPGDLDLSIGDKRVRGVNKAHLGHPPPHGDDNLGCGNARLAGVN